jgi:Tfp pilus assembly protein PilN
MIKVNLLKDQHTRARKKFVAPKVSRNGLIFVAIVVLAAGIMGFWTIYVQKQVQTGRTERERLRREDARLQGLKTECERFEKLTQSRQSRIDVIERLKTNQTGPVLLLNNVIRSIPRDGALWLTSLTQKAERTKIIGFTQRTEVIPDFMTNLINCGMFDSVDLELIESQKDSSSKFSLVCISGQKKQAE